MDHALTDLDENIEGVFVARQQRSQRLRDAYIKAGFEMLKAQRFSELRVTDLAERCGYSVGSFYTRFVDKEAYFRALRFAAVSANRQLMNERFTVDILAELQPLEALDALVELLADIFTGETRGVLRESLLRILEPEDAWAPMRESGKEIQARLFDGLENRIEGTAPKVARAKLGFCYQITVGVLQNDLVNDYHVISTRDQSIRIALKAALRDHMQSASKY